MGTVNSTAFSFAGISGRMTFPGHSLTLIVKGTFELSPGAVTEQSKEQPFPTGDEYYPDDEEMQGSPRYESDFAYYKPRSDLLLVGKCHPPGGKPVPTCSATFRVGYRSRTLSVAGNRRWEKHGLRWRATEPEHFTEMELRYENSFGGGKTEKNPVGKGDGLSGDGQGDKVWLLPNIEDPIDPVKTPKSRSEPAGFGPLSRRWQARRAKTGTYTGNYLERRWPWFPEDFDWSHFNAAPEDMQVEGYLRGDEELYFENLHPIHAQYRSRLPGVRVRCFLNKLAGNDGDETGFVEVTMNLDTLWVDAEAEKLALIWRGWAEVLSEDYEEVQDIFILSEPLAQEPAPLEECRRQFLDKQAEEEKSRGMEPEKPEAQPEEGAEPAAPAGERPGIDPAYLHAQANAILAQMGIDPESLPPEAKERQSRLIRKLTETDVDKVARMERQELDVQIREAFSKLDLDPDHLPPLSAKAKAEQLRFMNELGVKPADVAADPELGKFWAMMGALLPKMGVDPENLDRLIEQAGKQYERLRTQFGVNSGEGTEGAKGKEAPPLTREDVRERAARAESFVGEDLHGLDLSGLELEGLDFSNARLAGANLAGADLSGADLSGANLANADLKEARLDRAIMKDADLAGGMLIGTRLAEAVLTDAVFEKAQMAGAILDRVEARGANFSEADLTESSIRESACSGADFSKAVLDRADFQGADLREASVEGALGRKINLAETDLTGLRASGGGEFTGGVFTKAVGTDSIWENSDLTGSDFRGSQMEGATFTAACLKQADLSYADMKFSRFNRANLTGARMVRMNLFQGSLEKADLTGADLSGSNMYGVEFLDAIIEGIQATGTNLKMSKLHEMMAQT